MREHFINSAFGALEYIAYPAGMLLLAPAILNVLGINSFGIWALANAVLMTGAILASGFGDSNIRSVAQARATHNDEELVVTVRSALGIHLVLGIVVAAAVWLAAPAISHLTVKTHRELAGDCLWSIRITAGLVLLRALETVCVSTQRAFNRYGTAIGVSVAARIASLLLACVVPIFKPSVAAVLAASLIANAIALSIQMRQLKSLLGVRHLPPMLHESSTKVLLGFGIFTWIQAASGLLVGQVDRLTAGMALGASAVAVYTICVQLTQPIYGIAAAGLHFLFPLLASDSARGLHRRLRRSIVLAIAGNFTFVALALASLLLFGKSILRLWVGIDMANAAAGILPAAAWGSALSALAVTGCYALLAIGRPKAVAILNIVGGAAMAAALPILIPRFGVAGVAYSRLLPGFATLLVYIPLFGQIKWRSIDSGSTKSMLNGRGDLSRPMHDMILCERAPDPVAANPSWEIAPRRYANVLGVAIDAVDMEQALMIINSRLQEDCRGYVCFVDVHGILEALKSEAVAETYGHAAMAMPDGTPTVWVGRAQGLPEISAVTGPGLMNEVFRRDEFAGYSHYFYGGEPGVAEDLSATLLRNYPWTRIAGTYTPPFRELTFQEEEELVAEVNRLRPDILWVGIGTPRQDLWMQRMLPRLETRMMFGVGAAFDFLTGRIRLCPEWMKRAGLHWLHRLAQDPARLWMRNLRNTAFLWHIALQLSGSRRYPMRLRAVSAERNQLAADEAEQPEMADSGF